MPTAATQPVSQAELDELNRKAFLLRRDDQLAEAREVRARVTALAKQAFGPAEARVTKYQIDYVQLLLEMQQYEEAESVAWEAVQALEHADPAERSRAAQVLSLVYGCWGKADRARDALSLSFPARAASRPMTAPAPTRAAATTQPDR